jgi:hypothetical protein
MAKSRDGFVLSKAHGVLTDSDGQIISYLDQVHAAIRKGNTPKYAQKKAYDDLATRVDRGEEISPLELKAKKMLTCSLIEIL